MPSDASELPENVELLRRAFEAGTRTFGALPLAFAPFSRRASDLTRRRLAACGAPDTGAALAQALTRTHGADLYLAIACDHGVPEAWDCFTDRYAPRLCGLARHLGLLAAEAEDLARDLPGDLVLPPPSGAARTLIGTYDGSGTLFDWAATILARRIVDRGRTRARAHLDLAAFEAAADEATGARASGIDPAGMILDAESVGRLEEGLRSAWRDLTLREELSLLLRFGEGLPQRALVPLFGVSESVVSRTIKAAIGKIQAAVLPRFFAASPEGWRNREGLWRSLRDAVLRHLQVRALQSDILSERRSRHGT